MEGEEFDALVTDIREKNGIKVPLVFWRAQEGDAPILIDGRNRLDAVERAIGPVSWATEGKSLEAVGSGGTVKLLKRVETGGDPQEIVLSLNVHRRHLTREQRRDLIAKLLRANPERSDNATAKLAGSSDKTVTDVRHGLASNSEIPNNTERRETNGRRARGRKPSPAKAKSPTSPKSTKRDLAINGFSTLLNAQPHETLEDLARLLDDVAGKITIVPLRSRTHLIQRYMRALGVGLQDIADAGPLPGRPGTATVQQPDPPATADDTAPAEAAE